MDDRAKSLGLLSIAAVMLLACVWSIARKPILKMEHAASEPVAYRIDPNHADADTLCLLPRIGPGIAPRLIDDRKAHGPFHDAADLTRVPMIGEKTVAALSPWVRFTEPLQQ